ncbi:MAG: ABC transporter permease [Saprospiraceae bacterium]|nr:ABC transporter permease [Saprospiraceae bacterium]
MLSNYLKIALRNLLRNKTFSALNIAGLALGMATCLVILLYLQHELSYDRYNKQAERIVRVLFRGTVQGEKMNEATVMPPVAQTLKKDYPEVEVATRLREAGAPRVRVQGKKFEGDPAAYVDANFFQVFTLPFLQGDAATALQKPNTVVLSKTLANKYFGATDPLGKVLELEGWPVPCTVTGVMKDVPDHSHFHFELFAAMSGLPEAQSDSWMRSNFFTYLLLSKPKDLQALQAKLPQVVDQYLGPQMQQAMGLSLSDFRKQGNELGLILQPLTDIHLSTEIANPLAPNGNIQYVYMFSAIALFILLIACINFMNLSTAGASKRAREVGVRKVMGVAKSALVAQFLTESLLLTGFALVLAAGLAYLALPVFNDLLGVQLSANLLDRPDLWAGLLGVGLLTGILAGSYPAFFLSNFQPAQVLKGKPGPQTRGFGLRSGLVVFQFAISIALVVCTIVVSRQLVYIQNKQLGYEKEQVLVLSNTGALGQKLDAFRQQLAQDPRVRSISRSGFLPAGDSWNNNFFVSPESDPDQMIKTLRYEVDEHYIPTLGMKVLAGRNFSPEFRSDTTGVLLNESAVKAFGFGENAIGRSIRRSLGKGEQQVYEVIGVVQDFHFRSLHEPISPLVMTLSGNAGDLIMKAGTSDLSGLLTSAKNQWDQLTASEPFVYSFLDQRFDQSYRAEQKTALLLGIFAGLTIFVACLGLFGLVLFSTVQRSKEIGIRKVLGASVAGITGLLAKDFLKLVVIAIFIASPVAYYVMQKWLADFAYRIDIQWWMFVAAALAAVCIAFLTVALQSVRAALANPVESLRSE